MQSMCTQHNTWVQEISLCCKIRARAFFFSGVHIAHTLCIQGEEHKTTRCLRSHWWSPDWHLSRSRLVTGHRGSHLRCNRASRVSSGSSRRLFAIIIVCVGVILGGKFRHDCYSCERSPPACQLSNSREWEACPMLCVRCVTVSSEVSQVKHGRI